MIRALSHLGSLEPLSPVLVYDFALHHEHHSPYCGSVPGRIAIEGDHVRCMSGLSEPISLSKSALARAGWRRLGKGSGF